MTRSQYKQEMAERFANVLETKGLEWKKDWNAVNSAPYNAITGKEYRGCNAFNLSMSAIANGYDDPRWATMTQIKDSLGKYHNGQKWQLQKGTKGVAVEYYFPYDTVSHKALTWDEYKIDLVSGRKMEEYTLAVRYTYVFNASRIDGIEPLKIYENDYIEPDRVVVRAAAHMNVPVMFDGGDSAYYSPSKDMIHLPDPKTFSSEYGFSSTALHELAHATGHFSRLGRDLNVRPGTQEYAYEELIAEMASCFVGCGILPEGFENEALENHEAYVRTWAEMIRSAPELLVRAVKDAQGACSYLEDAGGLVTDLDLDIRADHMFEISDDAVRTLKPAQKRDNCEIEV